MALLLCIAVAGVVWWYGTKNYDFLQPPSPTEIEFARQRAARELAQPSDLFAVDPVEDPAVAEIEPPAPPPKPPPPIPVIEIGNLEADARLDAWTDEAGKPAASFINLASHLEANTQMTWALLGWERVLDSSSPSNEEREAALKAVRRLRATLPPVNESSDDATKVLLIVEAPKDRLKLSERAAKNAAEAIDKASSGILKVSATVRKGRETAASPKLKVMLTTKEAKAPPSVETPAPESSEEIENEMMTSIFKLVGSTLALRDDIAPVSAPEAGELPSEALEYRITRLAWQKFAESTAGP